MSWTKMLALQITGDVLFAPLSKTCEPLQRTCKQPTGALSCVARLSFRQDTVKNDETKIWPSEMNRCKTFIFNVLFFLLTKNPTSKILYFLWSTGVFDMSGVSPLVSQLRPAYRDLGLVSNMHSAFCPVEGIFCSVGWCICLTLTWGQRDALSPHLLMSFHIENLRISVLSVCHLVAYNGITYGQPTQKTINTQLLWCYGPL